MPYTETTDDETDTVMCERARCGDTVASDDASVVVVNGHDRVWCDSCVQDHATRCERRHRGTRCPTVVPSNETVEVSGASWCPSCWEDYAVSCGDCGDCYAQDSSEIRYSDRRESYVCTNCGDDDEDEDDGIADYHSCKRRGFRIQRRVGDYLFSRRPTTSRDTNAGVLFFGVEFEIENSPAEVARRMTAHFGELLAGCESDGSLSDGVECVTQPATLATWRKAVPGMRDSLRGTRAASHDTTTCGMHVHVSRDAMSPLQVLKLLRLFGSDESTWARVFRRNLCDYAQSVAAKTTREIARNQCAGRYDAVSLSPSHTIEFRWPKGTIVDDTVIATLETIHAAIWYSREASLSALTFEKFALWARTTTWIRSDVQYAIRYWAQRGVIAPLPHRRKGPPTATATTTATATPTGDDTDQGPDETDNHGPEAPTVPPGLDRGDPEAIAALHPSLRPTWDDVVHRDDTTLTLSHGHPLGWIYARGMPVPTAALPADLGHPYFRPTRADYAWPEADPVYAGLISLRDRDAWHHRFSRANTPEAIAMWYRVAYISAADWNALPE
jgi:hypothetical protein